MLVPCTAVRVLMTGETRFVQERENVRGAFITVEHIGMVVLPAVAEAVNIDYVYRVLVPIVQLLESGCGRQNMSCFDLDWSRPSILVKRC